jgi:hypothetical protein
MTEPGPRLSVPEVETTSAPPPKRLSFWLRELPFTVVLVLTIAGVAYTIFARRPIAGYWEILAPIIGIVCIASGWQEAGTGSGRLRLIVTQALHWAAFLLVMNMLLLSSVQQLFNTQTTALAIFTLLALGTFTAGIQVFSWQVCVLGAVMAIGVPAIAVIENSALLVMLIIAAIVALVVVLWWSWRTPRAHAA